MRSQYFFTSLICLLFGFITFSASAEESDDKLTFLEGRYFEIVGTDHRSVSFANSLGEHVVDLCISYLQAGSHDFPQRIYVALRPVDRVDFDGDYQIQIGARGQVSLNFRWDATLDFETTCRAFAEAYVVRYANFNYGPGASERLRFWAVSALGSQAYLTLRPAQQGEYIQEARDFGILKVNTLLTVEWEAARANGLSPRQGYWVPYTMRRRGLGREDVGALLDRAIAGRDVTVALEAAVQPVDADQQTITLDAWWQSQMADYLSLDIEHYETMDVSRAWIDSLGDFDAYRASGGELKNLMKLWEHRDDEALRAVLSARKEIIALRLDRVNPAYFNCAQSLGALYETTLETDRRFEFIHAFTAYLSDWEDTKRLHDKTYQLLEAEESQ